MGCDTLGLEPELSLVKTKNLVGGGVLRMVNRTVPDGLHALAYSADVDPGDHPAPREDWDDRGCSRP